MKLHHKSRKEAEELAYHYLDVVGLRDNRFREIGASAGS